VKEMIKQQYWEKRAGRYSGFKWANDQQYLDLFVFHGNFKKDDCVLDVGIGTGLVARAVSPLVSKVVGIDTSLDMLAQCQSNGNIYLIYCDVRETRFQDVTFDKITVRNVFHHITKDTQKAMNECYRLLKENGRIIVGERVSPSDGVKKEYGKIFKIKDDRVIFIEEDLIHIMAKAGFRHVAIYSHWISDISVRGWLESSDLPKDKQDKIFGLHIDGSDALKRAYNMRIMNGDCIIDIKNIMLVGEK